MATAVRVGELLAASTLNGPVFSLAASASGSRARAGASVRRDDDTYNPHRISCLVAWYWNTAHAAAGEFIIALGGFIGYDTIVEAKPISLGWEVVLSSR